LMDELQKPLEARSVPVEPRADVFDEEGGGIFSLEILCLAFEVSALVVRGDSGVADVLAVFGLDERLFSRFPKDFGNVFCPVSSDSAWSLSANNLPLLFPTLEGGI